MKLSLVLVILSAFAMNFATAQSVDGLYYSSLMVKDGTFTWNVTQSIEYYEDIPVNVNFTVTLKDNLYPGPLSEAELEKVYASVKVDGNKYTGEGFPLFWHLYKLSDNGATNTTIREEFEAQPSLFNVTDAPAGRFLVNFTVVDDPYLLYVELEIDPLDGLTKRYYENFYNNADINSTIELSYLGYTTATPFQLLWALAGVVTIGALVVIRKKRMKN